MFLFNEVANNLGNFLDKQDSAIHWSPNIYDFSIYLQSVLHMMNLQPRELHIGGIN